MHEAISSISFKVVWLLVCHREQIFVTDCGYQRHGQLSTIHPLGQSQRIAAQSAGLPTEVARVWRETAVAQRWIEETQKLQRPCHLVQWLQWRPHQWASGRISGKIQTNWRQNPLLSRNQFVARFYTGGQVTELHVLWNFKTYSSTCSGFRNPNGAKSF